MKKVKVIKEILGLPVGTELLLNESTNNFEFEVSEREISEQGIYSVNNNTVISKDIVELWIDEFFEVTSPKVVLDVTDYKYIKPIAIKVWQDVDTSYVLNIEKELVAVPTELFDKLFKVIE